MEDAFTAIVVRFLGLGAFVWLMTEHYPDKAPIFGRLTKDARAYCLGPLLAILAFLTGLIDLEVAHPAMVESWPEWAHHVLTLTGVAFIGLAATQTARFGHKAGASIFRKGDAE